MQKSIYRHFYMCIITINRGSEYTSCIVVIIGKCLQFLAFTGSAPVGFVFHLYVNMALVCRLCVYSCVCVFLQCGELVQLQLTEAHPDLLEIGNNQDETKKLLEEHDQLLVKLKVQHLRHYIS